MMADATHEQRLLDLFDTQRLVRTRDLNALGVPRVYLTRLLDKGTITRIGRGLYERQDAPLTQWDSLAEVCRRIPKATISLLSALQVHELTTQSPHKIWITLPAGTHKPQTDLPNLEIVYMRDNALPASSIETLTLDGARIRVTTAAKTVADTFKFRKRIGKDIALEALSDYLRQNRDVGALLDEAKRDRVSTLVRPVLEGLLA